MGIPGKLLLLGIAACVAGCAGPRETWRGLCGTSARILEETRPGAVSKEFGCRQDDCRKKVAELLSGMKAYIYRQESQLIAVYVSEQDTTPVGIFLTCADNDKTLVEVSSPSTYAKERIARQLFAGLDRMLRQKKVNVQLDAVEKQ